jgi:Holliday junction DNA helicase RuvA
MFAFLRGVVAIKGMDHIALDVNGAGYHILVPEGVQRRLSVDQEARLLTYCYIREDAFQIFGFLTEEERRLFVTLLGINGVGPKAAMALLSALPPARFGQAVLENDVKTITKTPGIGVKTAQRIVLEMRAKMGQDTELSILLGETEAKDAAALEGDDVYEALISMGCTPQEAKRAATQARKACGDGAKDEEVLKAALRGMAKA